MIVLLANPLGNGRFKNWIVNYNSFTINLDVMRLSVARVYEKEFKKMYINRLERIM